MKVNNLFYYPTASIISVIIYKLTLFLKTIFRITYQYFKFHSFILKTKKIKNTKKNKKAFVFANGPSLRKVNFSKVNKLGFDVFVVNKFDDNNNDKLRFNFYVLSDPRYFDPSHKWFRIKEKIKKKIHKNKYLNLFVPFEFMTHDLIADNVYGFCDYQNESSNNVSNIIYPRGFVSLTSYKALSIALHLGYSKIYICGFDNSYFSNIISDKNNNLYNKIEHFYKEKNKEKDDENIKSYWKSLGYMLYSEHFLFTDIDKFAKAKGSKIINLDESSLVTSFEKKHNLKIYF
jgi:hypothetical protein